MCIRDSQFYHLKYHSHSLHFPVYRKHYQIATRHTVQTNQKFSMDNSPTASACVEYQRSASLIICKLFWRNTFRLINWRSWQWTVLHGKMLVFHHTWLTSTRLQRTVMHAGLGSLPRLQLVHAAPHASATKSVLKVKFAREERTFLLRSLKSSPKSQRLRRIDGQLQGKARHVEIQVCIRHTRVYCRSGSQRLN